MKDTTLTLFYIIKDRDARRNLTKTKKHHTSFIKTISRKSNQLNPKIYFACCYKVLKVSISMRAHNTCSPEV